MDDISLTQLNLTYIFMLGPLFIGSTENLSEMNLIRFGTFEKVLFAEVMREIRIWARGPIYGNLTQWPGVRYYDVINNE